MRTGSGAIITGRCLIFLNRAQLQAGHLFQSLIPSGARLTKNVHLGSQPRLIVQAACGYLQQLATFDRFGQRRAANGAKVAAVAGTGQGKRSNGVLATEPG